MRSIRRTDKDDPIEKLLVALPADGAGILAQEHQGQQDIVNSDVLPTDINFDRDGSQREALEAAGVKFLDVVDDDPLFRYVQFPQGWKRIGSDHDMWSYVADENGRQRIAVFYKAAFYDRKAHMSTNRRFFYSTDYNEPYYSGDYNDPVHAVALEYSCDGKERIIWRAEAAEYGIARDLGKAWLDSHFPNWNDYSAYWDLPEQEFQGFTK